MSHNPPKINKNQDNENEDEVIDIDENNVEENKKIEEEQETNPCSKVYLASLTKCRKAINTTLNMFRMDKKANVARFRAQVFAMRAVADIFKIQNDKELEDRLDELEAKLFGGNHDQT